MKNTKLSELLNSFSSADFRKFGVFLRSAYCNRNIHIIKFYSVLRKNRKNGEVSYNKEKTHNLLFPGEQYDNQRLRSLESELTQLGSDYLFFESNKLHSAEKEVSLLKLYRERQMHKNFEYSIGKINKLFESPVEKDWHYFCLKLRVKYEEITKKSDDHKVSLSNYFEEADQYSDKLFLHLKLSILNSMNNRSLITSSGFGNTWWFSAVNRYINNNILQIERNEKSIYLEFLISQMKLSGESCWYDKFMNFVITSMHEFQDDNLKYIMGTFTGYHIDLISKVGFSENFRIFFRDLKRLVENGIYLNQRIIFHTEFMNVIITAASFSEFQWVEEFRKRYLPKVNTEFFTEVEKLSEAYVLFGRKMYKEAVYVLSKIKSTTSYFYGYIKVLNIKCYYELGQIDNLLHSLEAFKKFIQRKKQKRVFDTSNFNMVQVMYKLIDLRNSNDANELRHRLELNPLVSEINWIKEKITEIK